MKKFLIYVLDLTRQLGDLCWTAAKVALLILLIDVIVEIRQLNSEPQNSCSTVEQKMEVAPDSAN